MVSNTLEAELLVFENYSHSAFTLSSKTTGYIRINKQKNKCVDILEIIRLIIIKKVDENKK